MTTQAATGTTLDASAVAGLYLTFALGDELYGVEILGVQEIIQLAPITEVPRLPDYLRGVLNLRGKVIPIIDLRRKFDMDVVEDTAHTCIVVAEILTPEGPATMGIVVDQVAEVVEVKEEHLEPAPEFGGAVDTDFLLGVGKVDNKLVMLLDIQRVLVGESLSGTASPRD